MLSLSKDVEHALAALVLLARCLDSTSCESGQIGHGRCREKLSALKDYVDGVQTPHNGNIKFWKIK